MRGFFKKADLQSDFIAKSPISCASCSLYKDCKSPKMKPTGKFKKGILLIGENPDRTDDRKGKPFQGKYSKLIQKVLKEEGINIFEDCLLTNAVMCFTKKPQPNSISCCRPKLIQLIKEYKPKLIILFGTVALNSVIGRSWKKKLGGLDRWRGFQIPDRDHKAWICPVYSPSFVNHREEKDGNLAKVIWKQDIKKALSKLNESIIFEDESKYITYIKSDKHFKSILPALNRAELMSFDYEGTGLKPHAKGHLITNISACIGEKECYSWMNNKYRAKLFKQVLENPRVKKTAHNCFSGDTKYLTKDGIKSFIKTAGTIQTIWNKDGWHQAKISKFEKATLIEITIVPYNRSRSLVKHKIKSTKNHRWNIDRSFKINYKSNGWERFKNIETKDLKVKDRILADFPKFKINKKSEAFKHGLIFADGARTTSSKERNVFAFQIRLCGWKEKYKNLFPKYTYPKSAKGDPVINWYKTNIDFKQVPQKGSSAHYIADFIEGWQKLDGSEGLGGSRILATIDKKAAEWLKRNASIGGWICSGFNKRKYSGFGIKDRGYVYSITLTKQKEVAWTISNIQYLKEKKQTYCATVIDSVNEFTLQYGVSTCNCSFENMWSFVILKAIVQGWEWCSMNNAHILDNRRGISGLKFQTYINFGVSDYDSLISDYLVSPKDQGANAFNKILKFFKEHGEKEALRYCGLDSIYGYKLTLKQMGLINYIK